MSIYFCRLKKNCFVECYGIKSIREVFRICPSGHETQVTVGNCIISNLEVKEFEETCETQFENAELEVGSTSKCYAYVIEDLIFFNKLLLNFKNPENLLRHSLFLKL